MKRRPDTSAAGIVLAFCLIAGAVIGVALGEPSVGLLAGLAAGIAFALIVALIRRKS